MSSSQDCNTKSINPAKHWCFTYNNHTLEIISSICSICSKYCDKYVFQEEIGEQGTPHLQGYLCFRKKRRPFSVFKDRNFHWEITRSPPASISYCSDRAKRKDGGIIRCAGLPQLHLLTVTTIGEKQFWPWQSKAVQLIDNVDDRTIYWIYEGRGNTGKSSLCKYLCVHRRALLVSGKGNDIKYGIIKYFEQYHRYPSLVIVDIPRQLQQFVSYSAIEEIKNGCFFCGKYESSMAVFDSPRLICFSNARPQVELMSRDRWQIYRIVDKELVFEFA